MANEKIEPSFTASKNLPPKLVWMSNFKVRLRFTGSCLKQDKAFDETFTPKNVVNLYIFYKLDRWSQDLNAKVTLKDCLFGNVKITKNADPNKYPYLGYGTKFDSCSLFSIPNFDWGENVIVFGVDMSSSVHPNNKNRDIVIFGKGQTQGLRKYYTNSRSRIFY